MAGETCLACGEDLEFDGIRYCPGCGRPVDDSEAWEVDLETAQSDIGDHFDAA
ncbi:MAG TPA: hypothetical protein VE219_01140 [Candidatus Sulfotelmatobacter sp.]|nr:hypothetical protein [Candidatus Sulfotelmatobacter sp.]